LTEAQNLFNDLRFRGFTLAVEGDSLFVTPRSGLSNADCAEIAANKSGLIALMTLPARPHLTDAGELCIPLDSDPRFRYWADGQSLFATLIEMDAPLEMWRRHAYRNADLLDGRHGARCKGEAMQGTGFVRCGVCGYYCEMEVKQ